MLTVQMGSNGNGTYKQTRTFVYNNLAQLTSATTPEKGTVTYSYFPNGVLYSKTDAKGQLLCYNYDTSNRLTQIVQSCTGYSTSGGTYGPRSTSLAGGTVLSTFAYNNLAQLTSASMAT